MVLWLSITILLASVVLLVTWPLVGRRYNVWDETEFNIAVFRHQIEELVREESEGRIDRGAAEDAKAEISRRILAAANSRTLEDEIETNHHPVTAGAIATLLAFTAIIVYLYLGSPNEPSHQFADRVREKPEHPMLSQGQNKDLSALADRLEKRLLNNPKNLEGWRLLARTYMTIGNFPAAIRAFESLIKIDSAQPSVYAAYGEALALADSGEVTLKSREAFLKALHLDPKEPTARYYLALAEWQNGLYRKAYDSWAKLLANSPMNAPWIDPTQARLEEASKKLGLSLAALPKPLSSNSLPKAARNQVFTGPSTEDVAEAQNLTPQERQAMIKGMVTSLATKLQNSPDNFDGWMRLIRSYSVLGEKQKAEKALRHALTQFNNAPFLKRNLVVLGRELGLAGDLSDKRENKIISGPRGPTEEDFKAARELSAEDRQEMIRGMVARLAARLEETPNDVQGWMRLARSYNILGKLTEARDAMAKAAKKNPNNVEVLTVYARTIRTAAGNKPTPRSLETMQQIVTIDPEHVEALFFIGLAAARAGEINEARLYWQKAKSKLPKQSAESKALQKQIDGLSR